MKDTEKNFSRRKIGKFRLAPYCLTGAWSVLPYIGIKPFNMPDDNLPVFVHPGINISIGWGRWYAGISVWNPTKSKYRN